MGVIPAITGKVELVYEGEQEGSQFVAESLIGSATNSLLPNYFPKVEKLEKEDERGPYESLIEWFFEESSFELLDDASDKEYAEKLNSIPPLNRLIEEYQDDLPDPDKNFMKEFLLWSLVENKKLSKHRFSEGLSFNDMYGGYIRGL